MSKFSACVRQGLPIAPCLHRYVAPKNRPDFRERISDPYAFAVRLTGAYVDVDLDEKQQVIPAFGRNQAHSGFSASMVIPAGSVHQTITNAPSNPFDFNKIFGGLSIGGFDFQSEHSPFVIERNPDTKNYLAWRSARKRGKTLIRRKHCYVSFDPLPPGYAVVWDRFPGHGLLVNTDPVLVTDVIEIGDRNLFTLQKIECDMTWTYECTVLMMTPDDHSNMIAGKPAPPGPQFRDDRFAAVFDYLTEFAATADLDQDADDSYWSAELLSRRPEANFDNAKDYFSIEIIAEIAQQLRNYASAGELGDQFEKAEFLASQLSNQVAGLPHKAFYRRPRYPSIRL